VRVGVRGATCFDLTDTDGRDLAQPDGATDHIALADADADRDRVTFAEPDGITDTNTIAIAAPDRDDRRARTVLRGRRRADAGARLRTARRDLSGLDAHAHARV
jgi:hypothetical protein